MTTDLFDGGQASLFGDGDDRIPHPQAQSYTADPERIRQRLGKLLDQVCTAERMPWSERDARMWRKVFPQMANWLPADERDRLRLAFSRELERLDAAV